MATLELFKAGEQTSSSGTKIVTTVGDLQKAADTYNEMIAQNDSFKAPLVLGHPKDDAPAHGWFSRLFVDPIKGVLQGEVEQVSDFAKEAVSKGSYKKGSISFYSPQATSNPAQGKDVLFMRHFGLLGAAAPAVAGLAPVSFSGSENEVLTFEDQTTETRKSVLHGLRKHVEALFTLFNVDKDEENEKGNENANDDGDGDKDSSAATDTDGDGMGAVAAAVNMAEASPEVSVIEDKTAEFAERETALSSREAEILARELAIESKETDNFCEALIAEGKLLPNQKTNVVSLLGALKASSTAIEFTEGGAKPAVVVFQEFLGTLPKQVTFSEVAGDAPAATPAQVNFSVAPGYSTSAEGLEQLAKARALAAEQGVSLTEALKKI